MYEMS